MHEAVIVETIIFTCEHCHRKWLVSPNKKFQIENNFAGIMTCPYCKYTSSYAMEYEDEMLTPPEIEELLFESVYEFNGTRLSKICTASKIGPNRITIKSE